KHVRSLTPEDVGAVAARRTTGFRDARAREAALRGAGSLSASAQREGAAEGMARPRGESYFHRMTRSCCLLFIVLAACGGSGSSRATETARPASEAPAEPSVDAPCTAWDPEADPLIAPADVAAPPATARRGWAELRFCILREGTGPRPTREDTVPVHYTGWTTDGRMFDSSHTRGEPSALEVSGVIAGWQRSLPYMRVGEVRRLWIPEALAYRGQAGAPAGMLVFDVELVDIQ